MIETIQANWLALVLALVIGLLVAWWLFGRASTRPDRHHAPDVLDEGAAPARRNQALIDAPPAAQIDPPAFAGTLGGMAEAVAIGAQDVVEAAEARAPVVAGSAPPEPRPQPEPVITPEADSAPVPEAPGIAPSDDLSRIKGLGPKLQALLPQLGITSFAQIAALTEADLAELDGKLGAFAGRPVRDGWVEQAGYLAAGDVAGFEARFGKV